MRRFLSSACFLLQVGSALAAEPILVLEAEDGNRLEFLGPNLHGVAASHGVAGESPVLQFRLDDASSKEAGAFTASHIGKPIAILICGTLLARPVVNEAIWSGSFAVTVDNAELAETLARNLRSGTCH